MEIVVPKGRYVLAVSGGVDSVALLDMLTSRSDLELIVAHFDHGIRDDSAKDESFVRLLAEGRGLKYVSQRVELGKGTSENVARVARYEFLYDVLQNTKASHIITAHHQDDLLETMILNVLRGTGRKGLNPLLGRQNVLRPLLPYSKQEILTYARSEGLIWREDSTNTDDSYKRNALRHQVMPRLNTHRQELIAINQTSQSNNSEIEQLLEELDVYLASEQDGILRARYVTLPHAVAAEYMHWLFTSNSVKDINREMITNAVIASKTLLPGKKLNIGGSHWLQSEKSVVKIMPR